MKLVYVDNICSCLGEDGKAVASGVGPTKKLAKADLLRELNSLLEKRTRELTLAMRFVVNEND